MSKQQLLQDLTAARALIDTPAKWTQEVLARDANGYKTSYTAADATCFCSMGAFVRIIADQPKAYERDKEAFSALDAAAQRATGDSDMNIITYNDTHTYAEVIAVWDNAIAAATKAAQLDNLEVLLAAVQAQPETLFDLSKYQQKTTCGTMFCTAGLATTLPHFQALGFTMATGPSSYSDRPFTGVKVGANWIFDRGVVSKHFGAVFDDLFSPAGCSDTDDDLGYLYDSDSCVANMTDKELAVARLKRQIAKLKEQA